MALVLTDRVQQTGTANTTVSFTLSGSVTGFQSFTSGIGNGNTTYYAATDASGNWEVGLGTYSTTGPTLTRTTIYASSNSGSAVTFSGTVNVWCDYPAGKALYTDLLGTNVLTALGTAVGSAGAIVVNGGVLGTPTSGNFSSGTFTWPTFNQNTSGTAAGLSATLVATSGGTGTATTAVGDLLQGATTNTWSKLAAVATGNALISGGVTTASSWGKIGLTTHVSGTLPIANGGTNSTATATAGGAGYGTGTAHAYTAAGTSGQPLISAGTAAPAFGTLALGTANTNVSGSLTVTNGGTGAATLTGIVIGNGTSAFTTVTAPSGTVVGTTDTQTLTNKRITSRIISITGAAGGTITPTSDTADQYNITALGATASFAVPSGTPTDGQKLSIRIYSAAAQTLSWTITSTGYRVIGTTLPTTTGVGKTIYVGCVWNAADSFWDVVAVATQA